MVWIRLALIAMVLGCLAIARLAAEAPAAGTVFVVGGVGGMDPLQTNAPLTLPLAGVPHCIQVFRWTHGKLRACKDIQDTPYLLARAGELARLVLDTQERQPGRPIYLVGHSAGAAIVVAAAARLPAGSIERIVLLSPALSPTFNLCPALRVSRREIVSFNSTCDCFVLGAGTSLFGTADRIYTNAAGKDGFVVPAYLDDDERQLYHGLVQISWKLESLLVGYWGGHNGTVMPIFIAHQVAPWLMP